MDSANILIIDDNVANLKVAEKILEPYCKTTLLTSGVQAFKYLSKHRPDLILLDMYMPAMDGFEVLKTIKEQEDICDIPIIMLSTIHDAEKEVLGLSLGVRDFIYKPFIPEIFLNRVQIHIEIEKYKCIIREMSSEKTLAVDIPCNTDK